MPKIYTNISNFEVAQENDFQRAVEELGYYQVDNERTTIDGEWTESDLKEDVLDEAYKLLHTENTGWLVKNKNKAADYIRDYFYTGREDLCLPYICHENYCRAYHINEYRSTSLQVP